MTKEASWLECPVCEYRFAVPPEYADKSGKCPKCDKVFEASECQLPEKPRLENETAPEIPPPIALEQGVGGTERSSAGSLLKTPPPPDLVAEPGNSDGNSAELASPDPPSPPKLDDQPAEPTYVAAEKKQVNPNQVLLLVSGSCILAIALLIGIPVIASMIANSPEDGSSTGSGTQKDLAVVEDQPKTNTEKTKSKNPKTGRKKSGNRKKIKPDLTVAKFTEEELQQLWAKCHESIVLVNCRIGMENRTGYGVVVSRDGRIATALSLVAGASNVRVRIAKSNYGAEDRWHDPVAAVSLVNAQPALNLAIIQVGSDTVPVSIRTASIRNIERGVVPVLNNKASKEFLRQTRIRPAKPFDEFSAEQQQAIQAVGLSPASNDYLTVHSVRLNRNGLGAPVFDEQGKLVGIHITHHPESRSSFLVPSASISKALNDPLSKAIDFTDIGPLPTTPAGKAEPGAGTKPGIVKNSPGTKKPAEKNGKENPTNAAPKPSSFQAALELMKRTQWKFTHQEDYQAAQAFAVQWFRVNKEYAQADFTRRIKIEELKNEMTDQMKNHLFWPAKTIRQTINASAVEAYRNKDEGWVACVRVLKPSGIAPDVDDEPAVLVELVETGEKALLVTGEVEGPFIQGTEWIVFGLNQKKTRLNTSAGKCMVIHLAGVKKHIH